MKNKKASVSPAEKPRHLVMLTSKGKVLIPVREAPPERRRGFPIDVGLVIHDMRAVLK